MQSSMHQSSNVGLEVGARLFARNNSRALNQLHHPDELSQISQAVILVIFVGDSGAEKIVFFPYFRYLRNSILFVHIKLPDFRNERETHEKHLCKICC